MTKQIIRLQLSSIEPDYGQYKPLRPMLTPYIPIVVEIPVAFGDDDYFVGAEEVTLTTDGFAKLMKEIQETIGAETFRLNLQVEETKNSIKQEMYNAK